MFIFGKFHTLRISYNKLSLRTPQHKLRNSFIVVKSDLGKIINLVYYRKGPNYDWCNMSKATTKYRYLQIDKISDKFSSRLIRTIGYLFISKAKYTVLLYSV